MITGIKFKTVDEYIETFPAHTKKMLQEMRNIVRAAAPKGTEVISYNMPAIKLHGILVYYAGYKNHIGFYPTGSGIEAFKKQLAGYEGSKGTVKFSLDSPLPVDLITKIVKFRLKADAVKQKAKSVNQKIRS